jgi:hypothetical protein
MAPSGKLFCALTFFGSFLCLRQKRTRENSQMQFKSQRSSARLDLVSSIVLPRRSFAIRGKEFPLCSCVRNFVLPRRGTANPWQEKGCTTAPF